MAVIKIIDIETAPKLAYVWRFFKENISPKQVQTNGHIMSFASKNLGNDEVLYMENRGKKEKELVAAILKELDEADIVVAHNASRFDLPMINARAAVLGFSPPSPYKVVDTLSAARSYFRFDKNSLEYVADILGCSPKLSHKEFAGFELWLECLRQNDRAWEEMKKYNIQDVITLEEVYLKMRPWIKTHPNVAIHGEMDKPSCGRCHSTHLHWRGYYKTNAQMYHRYQCQSCGGWGSERFTAMPKENRKNLMKNV